MSPTPQEIAADVTRPSYQCQLWTGSGWGANLIASVEDLSSTGATTGDLAGFAFGTGRDWQATVTIDRGLFGEVWERRKIRIGYGLGSSSPVTKFVGVITDRSRGGVSGTWSCKGLAALVRAEKIWSPLFRRRPFFTRTTLTSIEDPANSAYRGGIGNYLFWTMGGRPWEQAASYPNAPFYYRAEQAVIAPEWSWLSGENPWAELDRLCKACGGQVFQDDDGTMRYVGPLGLALANPVYTFTDEELSAEQRAEQGKGPYEDKSEEANTDQTVTAVTCSYTSRVVQGFQKIYEDTEARLVRPGLANKLTLTLDTALPIYDANRVTVEVDAGIARTAARPSPQHLLATIVDRKATRFTVELHNTLGENIQVYGVRLSGRPVSAGALGSAFFSASGSLDSTRVLEVPDNPLIQSRSHAERLCRMLFDFFGGARGLIRLTGCPIDTRRYIGEPVFFTSIDPANGWGEVSTRCRIVRITYTGDGFMDVELGRAEGLPVGSDFYVVGQAYSAADVRQLCY